MYADTIYMKKISYFKYLKIHKENSKIIKASKF